MSRVAGTGLAIGAVAAAAAAACYSKRMTSATAAIEAELPIESPIRTTPVAELPERKHPKNCEIIKGGFDAYAYIKTDGTVESWGHELGGGTAPEGLENVVALVGSNCGFVALREDGTIELWGRIDTIKEQLTKLMTELGNQPIECISSTRQSFLIQGKEGLTILFNEGGTYSFQNSKVVEFSSTEYADVLLQQNGTLIGVGHADYGAVTGNPQNVMKLFSTASAFAALKSDGTVISWGITARTTESTVPKLKAVAKIVTTAQAFAAQQESGEIICWGEPAKGGSTPSALKNKKIIDLVATKSAFIALTDDKEVIVWGAPSFGGNQEAADKAIDGRKVRSLHTASFAVAAILEDGTVATWGDAEFGGNSKHIPLTNIADIFNSDRVFAAIDTDNQITIWGGSSPEHQGERNSLLRAMQARRDFK
eukprot:TRINITY_DN31458_c0_g1_i1.p1 TRINITY_DN31458_c0_g1~~TRINITY_DN31458_c0_g1_i1.p1  ORF type:complete len:424 (+),score=93.20 TRINITY_DN31458_c0_g1_i1:36-1307(+)